MARISQSLAGRVFVSNLLPFSLAELARRQSATVAGLLAGPARTAGTTGIAAALDGPWLAHAVRGFYPPIHDRNLAPQDCAHVPDLFSYVQVAVDEDSTPGRFILSGSRIFSQAIFRPICSATSAILPRSAILKASAAS